MALKQLIEDIRPLQNRDEVSELKRKYNPRNFDETLANVTEADWEDVLELIEVSIEVGNDDVMVYSAMCLTKRKLIEWKKHPEIFDRIFQGLKSHGCRLLSEKTEFWRYSSYRLFVKNLITLLKALQILKKYEDIYYELTLIGMRKEPNKLMDTVTWFGDRDLVQWKKYPDRIIHMFEMFYEISVANPELRERDDVATNVTYLLTNIFYSVATRQDNVAKKTAKTIVDVVSKLFHHCADAEWIDPDDMEKRTMDHKICAEIMGDYVQGHREETAIVKPMFSKIMELRESEDELISRNANNVYSMLGSNLAELMGDDIVMVAETFLENPNFDNQSKIMEAYKGNPGAFKKFINQIVSVSCELTDSSSLHHMLGFIWTLAKDYPEEFSTESVGMIAKTLTNTETLSFAMLPLSALAPTHKEAILPYDDIVIEAMGTNEGMSTQGANVLVFLATLGEEYGVKYMNAFVRIAKTADSNYAINLIYQLKVIGQDYPKALAKHKEYVQGLINDPALKAYAEPIMDIIEGRSLEIVTQDVAEQKEEIKDLDNRVTDTEQKVDNIEQDVEQIDKDVSELKTEVAEHGEKIEELEVAVEETNEKVEEIDKKTLSHAPIWSRDVAKLMNPEAEYDWRFLATKLGYSNDDIRNWATQPDPCLSLLDEWFATHKTRDATFAVEQALNGMNRTDAAMIVENALKQTEDVVVDDEDEAWDPPPIFISYQWGHQPEIKMLHKHLEKAGYKSWMDIGQMGGGDKLFAKIDQGIRAAKVIICCASEKYAQSANCNREVNLATTLGKPMIPLLMEKMAWPPAGSMGPIFGEYIFVRFFARPGETAGDDRYWPTAKFQELLMQLRLTHAPEQSLVTDPYTDWWSPPEEIIVIKPKEEKKAITTGSTKEESKYEDQSPDVFISYQWGKQPQIKKLFSVLTLRGYNCWLDIMQMGGGDSLYDKIDKGVRGCKVVLSCVTSKYALSANCRREVSLADALKKPIIPLLLEQITWPPAGPMSMPFTQLLYIDFSRPDIEIQNHWEVPQMDELMGKLKIHVPNIEAIEESPKDEGNNKSTEESTANCSSETTDANEKSNTNQEKINTNDNQDVANEPEKQDTLDTGIASSPQTPTKDDDTAEATTSLNEDNKKEEISPGANQNTLPKDETVDTTQNHRSQSEPPRKQKATPPPKKASSTCALL